MHHPELSIVFVVVDIIFEEWQQFFLLLQQQSHQEISGETALAHLQFQLQ